MSAAPLLQLDGVGVSLPVEGETRLITEGVSFSVGEGEALGLVGESGSGKSMTARTIMRLLPRGAVVEGAVRFDGTPILDLDPRALRRWRSTEVAMIFQDPRAHINAVRTIGDFLCEVLVSTRDIRRRDAERQAIDALEAVNIADASRRLRQHSYELSGGLLQRVMIAAALIVEPRLLLADEPTTALDVTTQEEVMGIIDELRRDRGMSMVFITHDLELAAAVCDRTAVMYAGRIVEIRPAASLHRDSAHPYTRALLRARPALDLDAGKQPLEAIPGRPLAGYEAPDGCVFADRCAFCEPVCRDDRPPLRAVGTGTAACHFAGRFAVEEQELRRRA
jgi:oligopeptide/dipeptide ABC transporter ATP-binding protein